ncbi:MmcQ/YjbR family DNA-binding protein [Mariniphaga sp.]|uniref:MmcQ/YjbR family DNA-binding protein n=1 Tax=Mariniphaga sp. TaxID=1954475 RepID=UPI00356A1858
MNIEELREYCMAKKGVTESFPFDESTLVFKVAGKMFCLTDLVDDFAVALKNDPEKNIELREHFPAVRPGYHMNKQHWNTVQIDGSISDKMLKQLIDESYWLIVAKLPKKVKEEFKFE